MGFVYTGCFTTPARGARGRGIGIYADGAGWAPAGLLGGLTNPSYLLKHPALPVLYAAHGDEDYVSACAIDGATGALTPRGRAAANGGNGVHIALSPDATRLVVANMAAGAAGVMIAPVPSLRADDQIVAYYEQAVNAIGTDVPFVIQDYPLALMVVMTPNEDRLCLSRAAGRCGRARQSRPVEGRA